MLWCPQYGALSIQLHSYWFWGLCVLVGTRSVRLIQLNHCCFVLVEKKTWMWSVKANCGLISRRQNRQWKTSGNARKQRVNNQCERGVDNDFHWQWIWKLECHGGWNENVTDIVQSWLNFYDFMNEWMNEWRGVMSTHKKQETNMDAWWLRYENSEQQENRMWDIKWSNKLLIIWDTHSYHDREEAAG